MIGYALLHVGMLQHIAAYEKFRREKKQNTLQKQHQASKEEVMVTRDIQLKWLAKNYNFDNQRVKYVVMSENEIGLIIGSGTSCSAGLSINCHVITREEWQQERDKMSSKPEIDNSWYERGEFPPNGTNCEVFSWGEWVECFFIGVSSNGNGVFESKQINKPFDCYREPSKFRPLRTERDKAIEEMKALCASPGRWESTFKSFAEAIYDDGYRKQE